jgi:hypothetical protein
LKPGTHFVEVEAPGFVKTAPRAIVVEGDREAALHVELSPEAPTSTSAPPPPVTAEVQTVSVLPEAPALPKNAPSTKANSSLPAGTGMLSVSSTPPAHVVIDGKPMGSTPLTVPLSAGPHSVVTIHPERGRKASGVTVKAGQTASVSIKL